MTILLVKACFSEMAHYCDIDWNGYRSAEPDSFVYEKAPSKVIVDKREAIDEVKKIFATHQNGSIRTDDAFILRFLHARKMKIEETVELMRNYSTYRIQHPELFSDMSIDNPLVQQALYDGFPGVLTERDRKGRCVLVFFSYHWDHCNYSLDVIYRALLLSLERLIDNVENQLNGFVIVIDWTDFSIRQSGSLSPRTLRLMVEGLQDCFPARFKGIHFVNQPWYVDTALLFMKPFLKDKAKSKIFLHGNNLSKLHEYVTKDVLPAELGGEGPAYNPMLWAEQLMHPSDSTMHSQHKGGLTEQLVQADIAETAQ